MLMTLKNKMMIGMDKLITEANVVNGVPAKILLEPQEAAEFIKEIKDNKILSNKFITLAHTGDDIDVRFLLTGELTNEKVKTIINQWYTKTINICYKNVEIVVVKKQAPDVPEPVGPINDIVKEGEIRSCPICHCSMHYKWFFWIDGCLNFQCANYYGK